MRDGSFLQEKKLASSEVFLSVWMPVFPKVV